MSLGDLLRIENLLNKEPNMKSSAPLGFLDNGRGESVYLNGEHGTKFVGLLEFIPGLGIRGKHYHKAKREFMYVISGKMMGYYWLPDDPATMQVFEHNKGDLIAMQPGLTHGFEAIERVVAIETSPDLFDIEDTFYPNNMTTITGRS